MPLVFCSHPVVLHQLPQVINQSELLWIHLMDSKKETHKTSYLWKLKEKHEEKYGGMTGFLCVFLTAVLSSFLMVDLPHRAFTPSTARAKRKSDSGCPLCSLSSFITAPTTSLLLFTRDIPYGEGNTILQKGNQQGNSTDFTQQSLLTSLREYSCICERSSMKLYCGIRRELSEV